MLSSMTSRLLSASSSSIARTSSKRVRTGHATFHPHQRGTAATNSSSHGSSMRFAATSATPTATGNVASQSPPVSSFSNFAEAYANDSRVRILKDWFPTLSGFIACIWYIIRNEMAGHAAEQKLIQERSIAELKVNQERSISDFSKGISELKVIQERSISELSKGISELKVIQERSISELSKGISELKVIQAGSNAQHSKAISELKVNQEKSISELKVNQEKSISELKVNLEKSISELKVSLNANLSVGFAVSIAASLVSIAASMQRR